MRLRRRIFYPRVHTTSERGRPITLSLTDWLVFDLSLREAQQLSDDLSDAIEDAEDKDDEGEQP